MLFCKGGLRNLADQGSAFATQSYDTTLLKVYSGGSDDAQLSSQ